MTGLHTNTSLAVEWGKWLANYFFMHGQNNPFLLTIKFGWRVVLEHDDEASALMPARLAEWDGSRRMIRLFIPGLHRHLGNSTQVLSRACAHELFHGLAAVNYRVLRLQEFLRLPAIAIPKLNFREEEIAAQVFSEAWLNS